MDRTSPEYFEHCVRAGIAPSDASIDAAKLLRTVEKESNGELAWYRVNDREEMRARAKAKIAMGACSLLYSGGGYRACVKMAIDGP